MKIRYILVSILSAILVTVGLMALDSRAVVMAQGGEEWSTVYPRSGPYSNDGQFVGNLMLADGTGIWCYVRSGDKIDCYRYTPEYDERIFSEEVLYVQEVKLDGCQNYAWLTVTTGQTGATSSVIGFDTPVKVAECSDPSRIFYPIVMQNGGDE